MSLSRRQFLASLGGGGLVYAFRLAPGAEARSAARQAQVMDLEEFDCVAVARDVDYTEWIAFSPDGEVTVFTGRTELGQGLKTVITALVCQGLDIPRSRLTLVMGDTDLCPDDGPTTGSAATKMVGWGFWLACGRIRSDLVQRAAGYWGMAEADLEYREGGVGYRRQTGVSVRAHELGQGQAVLMGIDPQSASKAGRAYVDHAIPNVNARRIVTGRLKYVGDIYLPGMKYADWLTPPYHPRITQIKDADLTAARALPGVKLVDFLRRGIVAVGDRYSDVDRALRAATVWWRVPSRPRRLDVEQEIRARAKLVEIIEKRGDVDLGLAGSDLVVSETYRTQNTAQAPIETDTAVARMEGGGTRAKVWASSQAPFIARDMAAAYLKMKPRDVQVVGMPLGGGFGGKISNPVAAEAAAIAKMTRVPVKLLYSRRNMFQLRGAFKAACLIDIKTGVKADGTLVARRIDSHQDVGSGTVDTYAIEHVLTRLYEAEWPYRRAISRGTSYVQNCFAIESHMDMVAAAVGMDPWEFRRRNVLYPAFVKLIDACAEMIGYDTYQPGPNEGIGLAVVNHGKQMGAVAAEVQVDRAEDRVRVKRLCGAFDIGTVINRNTATVGIRGAMTWGIGYALKERVQLDGHRTWTTTLSQYGIPRFSDIPPLQIAFLDNYAPGSPRGCGEMPVIPTIGAIANAAYRATGIRCYSTPLSLGPDQGK